MRELKVTNPLMGLIRLNHVPLQLLLSDFCERASDLSLKSQISFRVPFVLHLITAKIRNAQIPNTNIWTDTGVECWICG